jgi:hypothetical protein
VSGWSFFENYLRVEQRFLHALASASHCATLKKGAIRASRAKAIKRTRAALGLPQLQPRQAPKKSRKYSMSSE